MSYYDAPEFWDNMAQVQRDTEFDTVLRVYSDGLAHPVEVTMPEVLYQTADNPIGYTIEAHYPRDKQQWDVQSFEPSNICTGYLLATHIGDLVNEITGQGYVEFGLTEVCDPDDPEALIGWALVYRPVDPT